MRQGRATQDSMASTKREPIAHAVSVPAVAEIGIIEGRANSLPLYSGRGLEAPMQGTTSHPTGSQGRYK